MKHLFGKVLAVLLIVCLLVGTVPFVLPAVAETITTVYDFNGTDFDTTVGLNKPAVLMDDTSSVPDGSTDAVMSNSIADGWVAVGVDFAKPIDPEKIVSIKVRMYVPTSENASDETQLRILATNESTQLLAKNYETWTGAAFGQWCEIDITAGVTSDSALDANGYIDRFVIGLREKSGISSGPTPSVKRTTYYDSLIIESEGDPFVQLDSVTDTYDFNGTDFATPTDSHATIGTSFASAVADTSSVPSGFTDGVYAGVSDSYTGVRVDFGVDAIDLSKVTSVKMRLYVSSYTVETGKTPVFRLFGQSSGTIVPVTFDGTYDQWIEVEILDALKNTSITKNSDGTLSHFVFSLRAYGSATVYFDSITIEGLEGYFIDNPDPVTATVTPTKLHQASSPTQYNDWRFWFNVDNELPDGHYFGTRAVPVTIYDKDDNIIVSSETDTVRATYYHDGVYLMPYAFDHDYLKGSPAEGDYIVFAKGTYAGTDNYNTIVVTEDVVATYSGGAWVMGRVEPEEEVPDEEGGIEDGIFDFDGVAFETPHTTNSYVSSTSSFATLVANPTDVPEGFAGGVYGGTHGSYVATWVDFNGIVDLSKVDSIKMQLYVPTYTLESGKSTVLRTFGTGDTYVETVFTSAGGAYDQWVEIELLDILNNSKVAKRADGRIEKFLFAIRTYGNATVYFDKLIIEGTDYYAAINKSNYITINTLSVDETKSNKDGYWKAYLNTDLLDSLPGTAWETIYTDVPVTINNTEVTMTLKNAGGTQLFLADLTYKILPETTTYAKITVKAGEYTTADAVYGVILENDFTFYVYSDDVWNDAPPEDFTVDVTFEKMDAASLVSGSDWNMYAIPTTGKTTIGTPWQTKWEGVVYEIDGVEYTGTMIRANSGNGLYWQIPGTRLSPAADGATVVIKAGTYTCSSGDEPAIRVTDDFTFYVIKGVVTTEFDFDDPSFTATVFVDVGKDTYTVTDAETVTIDGETFNRGDVYDVIGVHTLVYTMYERVYTRELIIYRVGEVGDTDTVDVCDVVLLERYLHDLEELTRSALLGADMNADGAVTEVDLKLLRQSLLLIDDVLILCPAEGETVMNPSEKVVELTTNYDPSVSRGDELRTGEQLFHRDPLTVRWVSNRDVDSYTLSVASKSDFSDALVFTTDKTEYTLYNLIPNTTYYWKLTAGDKTSAVQTFVTADTVRTLTIDGVDNARDIGGYAALGGTMKYGKIYRTATLDNITEEGKFQMLTVLGVKTDFDVRTPGEGTAGSGSPLGEEVNYLNFNAPYYWNNLVADKYREAFIGEINGIADASNYPLVVHCSVGRDRTGTLLFVIEGLCGMSKADLFMEFELSALSAIGGGGTDPTLYTNNLMASVNTMYNNIQAYAPNATFAVACETFLKTQFDISQDTIDAIRANLIDTGIEEEPENPDNLGDIGYNSDRSETEIIQ